MTNLQDFVLLFRFSDVVYPVVTTGPVQDNYAQSTFMGLHRDDRTSPHQQRVILSPKCMQFQAEPFCAPPPSYDSVLIGATAAPAHQSVTANAPTAAPVRPSASAGAPAAAAAADGLRHHMPGSASAQPHVTANGSAHDKENADRSVRYIVQESDQNTDVF